MSSSVVVYLDGVDVTQCCLSGSWTRRLNRPAQATVTLPMDCGNSGTFWPDAGSRLRIDMIPDGSSMPEIVFHGFVLNCETDTGKDTGTTVYNAQDPMELWQWRPVRADDGDFSKPFGDQLATKDLFFDYTYAPSIMEAVLKNTEGSTTAQGNAGLDPPSNAEGPTFLTFGTFTPGTVDVSGAPVDVPMTIMELFSLLASTGTVDLVITPTDPGGGIMGTVDGYPGDHGTDLSGSVVFEYGTGAHNAAAVRWNRDMTNMVNKYWLYGGPRIKTAADPAAAQHWCFNVQGQDGVFDPGGTAELVPPGGRSVDAFNNPVGPPWTNNPIGERIYASRVNSGVRMKIDIFDAVDEDCVAGVGTPGRWLYRKQWQVFSYFSAVPREIIHVTPTRDTEIGNFDIGDLIGVEATTDVRGGFSGAQRVYEYTVSWDNDSVLTLSEIQTSADQE